MIKYSKGKDVFFFDLDISAPYKETGFHLSNDFEWSLTPQPKHLSFIDRNICVTAHEQIIVLDTRFTLPAKST